jgi:hypothetical protein
LKIDNKEFAIGFKIVLHNNYPIQPPFVYIDPTPNTQIDTSCPYVLPDNRIKFKFLDEWNYNHKLFNLTTLLKEIYKLYTHTPPVKV